ncbi:MAG: hypothetical protein HY22_02290 [[Candidatus Thermochlorobacteriaceae] bacterium GBChlB]|nr:MAG: hypothetical protein HY22_02290 [[Candidatus Thermochlorobacteriaceae] bacterium GBChlB]
MKSMQRIVMMFFTMLLGCTVKEQPSPMSNGTFPKEFDLQGHRGARGLLPENTIPAFLKALEFGVNTLELDVVISKDNKVVISHEPWFSSEISSTPDGTPIEKSNETSYNIYQLTYEDIARFDVGKRGHPRFPKQQPMPASKPLVAEMVRQVDSLCRKKNLPLVRFNVEIKCTPEGDGKFHPEPKEFARLVYTDLNTLGVLARSTVQSFDVRALHAMREIDSSVCLALLVENNLGFQENLSRLNFIPEIYSPYFKLVDETLVRETHSRKMKLIPWTVNDLDEMKRLLILGVDGIITDYPDIAAQIHKTNIQR